MIQTRLFIKIHGLVQGVNFRFYTQKKAVSLKLTGWVKNARDNTVEIETEGDREKLNVLLDWAQHGPSSAEVIKIEHVWKEFKGEFKRFEIVDY